MMCWRMTHHRLETSRNKAYTWFQFCSKNQTWWLYGFTYKDTFIYTFIYIYKICIYIYIVYPYRFKNKHFCMHITSNVFSFICFGYITTLIKKQYCFITYYNTHLWQSRHSCRYSFQYLSQNSLKYCEVAKCFLIWLCTVC